MEEGAISKQQPSQYFQVKFKVKQYFISNYLLFVVLSPLSDSILTLRPHVIICCQVVHVDVNMEDTKMHQ